MSTTIHLSPHGVFPDVCVSVWGLTVPYKIIGGNLIVERRTSLGALHSSDEIDVSMPDSTFPRVMQALGKTWLAYRAFRNGQESAVVREVLLDRLGPEHVLGPTWGNHPVCLSHEGLVAWQEPHARVVNGMRLDTGELSILSQQILPPGIAHLNGTQVVFVDDNRLSEPGMLNPVRSGDLIVGEGFQEGLIARLPGRNGSVMAGECLTPRCAQIATDGYAAVTWGPGRGAFLIVFGSDDIQEAPAPSPITKYVPPNPIPLDQIRELTVERLVAWYEQSGPPELHGAALPPGNAEIAVRGYAAGIVRPRPVIAMDGNKHEIRPVFAIRLGSEEQNSEAGLRKLVDLAWTRHREGWRSIVYWDALVREGQTLTPPFWPILPPDTLWEQSAFWWKWQSRQRYRDDLERVTVEACRQYGSRRVFIACQTHTTNFDLIDEPSQAIPIIQDLVERLNLLGVSIFNNSGRDFPEGINGWGRGGLTANPQLRPHWQKAFGRCAFPRWLLAPVEPVPVPPEPIPNPPDPPVPVPEPVPPVENPIPDPIPGPITPVPPEEEDTMRPPAVTVDRFSLDELLNGREMAFHDRENPELGYRARVFVKDGSVHAELSNNAGSAQSGQRRPVKTGGSAPTPDQPQPNPPQPQPQPPTEGISLKTENGQFLTVVNGVLRSTSEPSGFIFEQQGDRYGLKVNGKYLRAVNGGGGQVRADRDGIGPDEAFTIFKDGDAIAIQTRTGMFLAAESGGGREVNANRPSVGGWERFIPSRPFDQAPTGAALQGRIRTDGRFMVNDGGTFRWRFTSALTILTKSDEQSVAFLDWAAALGFNGIRVFAGHLAWAGQTAESARKRLPWLLEQAAVRGLYVLVTALTDTKDGRYDKRQHVSEIGAMCGATENALLELANEIWHPTQDDDVNEPSYLLGLRSLVPGHVLCSIGAPPTDEPNTEGQFDFPTLDYVTLHLDRGREGFQMVRRVRELELVSSIVRKPVINNEPIGADETRRPGSREDNPSLFYTLGVLNRIFEVGGVHHSQHGLMAELPGPKQQECARAFIAGSTVIPTEDRLVFKNARWADSPVAEANFHDESGTGGTVVRVYTGVAGNKAWSALVGLTGDPRVELKNGYRYVRDLGEMPGIRVVELER